MTFPTPDQEKQMLSDVAKVEAYFADLYSQEYVSMVVPWVADVCCHVKALLAEVELLRSTINEVQEKRIAAAVEGTEWKGKAQRLVQACQLARGAIETATEMGTAESFGLAAAHKKLCEVLR